MTVEYIGNCGKILGNIIDWDAVIDHIKDQEPAYVGPSHKRGDNVPGVGMKTWNTAWISRIHPGKMAPLHWDVHDNEAQFMLEPDKIRFHCHITQPAFGHAVLVDNQCFYNQPQGATYKWDSRRYWHAGVNAGLGPKYLFNFW